MIRLLLSSQSHAVVGIKLTHLRQKCRRALHGHDLNNKESINENVEHLLLKNLLDHLDNKTTGLPHCVSGFEK